MDHSDHISLIRDGVPSPGEVWSEFGSGRGAFTLALAELLGPSGTIYSVDKDRQAIQRQARAIKARFGERVPCMHYLTADYTHPLELPSLDGLLIANALHFQREKTPVLKLIFDYLRPGGRLVVVEYNVDRGNMWVPHPISYRSLEALAQKNGFFKTQLLAVRSSRFLGEIYAAMSQKTD
jgi:precorrin-6B methylase 2